MFSVYLSAGSITQGAIAAAHVRLILLGLLPQRSPVLGRSEKMCLSAHSVAVAVRMAVNANSHTTVTGRIGHRPIQLFSPCSMEGDLQHVLDILWSCVRKNTT